MLTECLGEFAGTMILILLGNGAVASSLLKDSKGHQAGWIAITTGWFIAVVMGVFVAQSVGSTNADINPAVSLAKYCWQYYTFSHTLKFIFSQIAGAFVGAVLVWLVYLPHWKTTEEADIKLMAFSTKPAIRSYPSNLLSEIIATAVLVLGVAAIFGKALESGPVSGLGPYLVGALVWGIGLSLGGPTGYAINPARDLGPRIAHSVLPISGKGSSDWNYAWVPVVGPILGGMLAAWVWILLGAV
ncbi:MAG TPA: MIP/aquaporin family protein [Candidatus Babeliaceae bacterium]|nr:MIP/aquaporin family protein [Candidatus Babeliaceae bacterium]